MARASVRSIRRGALAMALLAAACMNCGGTTDPRSEGPSGRATSRILTILGAASLKSVLDQAKAAYEAADPGMTLATSTDSSAATTNISPNLRGSTKRSWPFWVKVRTTRVWVSFGSLVALRRS